MTQASASTGQVVRTLVGAIAVATIVGCGLSLTVALLAVRLHAAGYSAHAIGFNTAAGGVGTLLTAPFITRAAHRIGVAPLLLWSLLGGGAALLGFTLTADYTAWWALRFVEGVSVTVMFVLSEFWIITWAPARIRGLVIAAYVTSLAGGFALGPLLLAITGTAGNLPFYIAGTLFVASAAPLGLNAKQAPVLETGSGKSFASFLFAAPAATLAALLHGAIEVAGLSLLPVYALRAGKDVSQGALFTSLFIVGNSVLQLPIGALADRIERRHLLRWLAILGLIGAVLLASFGAAHSFAFEAALLLWGGIVGALYPVGLGELGTLFKDADVASANSAYVMSYAAGILIGPPIIGEGLDLLPPSGMFWAIAMLIGLYLLGASAPAIIAEPARRSP